jgi:hypothetical protein
MKKPHFSVSQLNMLSRCGEQYRRAYVEGERIPPGIAAAKGTAVHRAAEENLTQKIETHQDISVDDATAAAAAAFDKQVEVYGITLSDDEKHKGEDAVLGEAKDRAVAMAKAHIELQAPLYQPLFCEEAVRLEIPKSSHDFLGIIDLVDDKRRVVDWKTTAQRKSQSEADYSLQLTAYALLYNKLTGQGYPDELRLEYLVDSKKRGPQRQMLRTYRGDSSVDALAARIETAKNLVKAGFFAPVEPGHWCCSPKWCGYWATCPYVDSERTVKAV